MKSNRLMGLMWLFCGFVVVVQADGNSPEWLYEQGVQLNQQGYLVDASVHFTDALSLKPDWAEAHHQRGLSFYGMGQHEHAVKDLRRAMELGLYRAAGFSRLVHVYTKQNHPRKLLTTAELWLEKIPSDASLAWYYQGIANQQMSEVEQARKAFVKAMEGADERWLEQIQVRLKGIDHKN